jgi:hypothetical protein
MRSARIVLASLAATALVVVASADGVVTGPPGSPSNPLVALPNPTPARIPQPLSPPTNEAPRQADGTQLGSPSASAGGRTQQGSAALHEGKPMVAPQATPRQQKTQPPSADRPCSLVTRAEAEEAIGVPIVEPLEAPQGPTCIFQGQSGTPYVTLAAQDASADELRSGLADRRAVPVAGRTGQCGTAGGPVLYVPLSEGRTLVVAAPWRRSRSGGFEAARAG